MIATIEISMYPLDKNYINHINEFLERINEYDEIEVNTNQTSTHLTGDIDTLFKILLKETKRVFSKSFSSVFVFKIIAPK
jgi:uncharacterized protein YqgV (UPF0045/DUF77 family)